MTFKGRENIPIDYLNGAGNSSRVLDPLEAQGVKKAFPTLHSQIPVSSIKSILGEAIALGGMRMVSNVISMEYGFIPPTINYLFPDQTCNLSYVINHRLVREVQTVLHLGISPEECFSSILMGVQWN